MVSDFQFSPENAWYGNVFIMPKFLSCLIYLQLLMLRTIGVLLPMFVMLKACSIIRHHRRHRQVSEIFGISFWKTLHIKELSSFTSVETIWEFVLLRSLLSWELYRILFSSYKWKRIPFRCSWKSNLVGWFWASSETSHREFEEKW